MYVNEDARASRGTREDSMSNVGNLDRIIRFILGAVLAVAPFVTGWPIWSDSLAFWGAIIAGAVLVATSALGFCPIYAALRLSSKRQRT
jgi:hypothetical protein